MRDRIVTSRPCRVLSEMARRNRGLAQNHMRYRLSVAPDGSESKATHKNMYKFCKITLTKKESSRRLSSLSSSLLSLWKSVSSVEEFTWNCEAAFTDISTKSSYRLSLLQNVCKFASRMIVSGRQTKGLLFYESFSRQCHRS